MLKYIKRYTTSDSQYLGLSFRKDSYLDNLFPIFDMQIPFTNNNGAVSIKTFSESAYIDKTNINENEFFVNTGIAVDVESVNFIAFPEHYNSEETQTTDVLPLSGKESFEGFSFLDDFNKNFVNYGVRKENFSTTEDNVEFLTLDGGTGLLEAIDGNTTITETISVQKPITGKSYDYDNINIISLTQEQYAALKVLKQENFSESYKTYLGISRVDYLTDTDDGFATAKLALRGLSESSEGVMESKEVATDIEVFAEDEVYNWDSDSIETARVLDAFWADENLIKTDLLPEDNHNVKIVVKTEGAFGKLLNVGIGQWEAFPKFIKKELFLMMIKQFLILNLLLNFSLLKQESVDFILILKLVMGCQKLWVSQTMKKIY